MTRPSSLSSPSRTLWNNPFNCREAAPWLGIRDSEQDFPGGPVVKILSFQCSSAGSIPDWGTKISHAMQPKKKNFLIKKRENK